MNAKLFISHLYIGIYFKTDTVHNFLHIEAIVVSCRYTCITIEVYCIVHVLYYNRLYTVVNRIVSCMHVCIVFEIL